jgi:hypothetical protein
VSRSGQVWLALATSCLLPEGRLDQDRSSSSDGNYKQRPIRFAQLSIMCSEVIVSFVACVTRVASPSRRNRPRTIAWEVILLVVLATRSLPSHSQPSQPCWPWVTTVSSGQQIYGNSAEEACGLLISRTSPFYPSISPPIEVTKTYTGLEQT